MAPLAEPAAELSHLAKADGSATFSYGGYAVIAAVNGPVEAQRRDENAFEALVDVIVRPAAGVGGEIPDIPCYRIAIPYACCNRYP
jgi:exosome complex component RRP46